MFLLATYKLYINYRLNLPSWLRKSFQNWLARTVSRPCPRWTLCRDCDALKNCWRILAPPGFWIPGPSTSCKLCRRTSRYIIRTRPCTRGCTLLCLSQTGLCGPRRIFRESLGFLVIAAYRKLLRIFQRSVQTSSSFLSTHPSNSHRPPHRNNQIPTLHFLHPLSFHFLVAKRRWHLRPLNLDSCSPFLWLQYLSNLLIINEIDFKFL